MYTFTASGANVVVRNVSNPKSTNQFTVATVPASKDSISYSVADDFVSINVGGYSLTPVRFGSVSIAGATPTSVADFIAKIKAIFDVPAVYRAVVTQSSTTAPVVTVLENAVGTITWTRSDVGVYVATGTNLLAVNKTAVNVAPVNGSVRVTKTSDDSLTFSTFNGAGEAADAILSETAVEILVYP